MRNLGIFVILTHLTILPICMKTENESNKAIQSLLNFSKSANLGNSETLCMLGVCYDNGLWVEQNYEKAFDLYLQSAKLGNSDALNCLGYLYENGVEQSYSKKVEYY